MLGSFVVVNLLVIAVLSLMTVLMRGESDKSEIAIARCVLAWRTPLAENPHEIWKADLSAFVSGILTIVRRWQCLYR